MNKNNVYYHEKIGRIPAQNVRTMVETELRDLSFDLGKRVQPGEPDFDYMVGRITNTLISSYPEWEMMYFDTCMKNGMLDEYDKGQSLTVKRLLVWMASFERSRRASVFARNESLSEFKEVDLDKFMQNGGRFPQIIIFRMQHKPDFDADRWTLEEIEKTEAFKTWSERRNPQTVKLTETIGRRAMV